jgi:hypothetical protein
MAPKPLPATLDVSPDPVDYGSEVTVTGRGFRLRTFVFLSTDFGPFGALPDANGNIELGPYPVRVVGPCEIRAYQYDIRRRHLELVAETAVTVLYAGE